MKERKVIVARPVVAAGHLTAPGQQRPHAAAERQFAAGPVELAAPAEKLSKENFVLRTKGK